MTDELQVLTGNSTFKHFINKSNCTASVINTNTTTKHHQQQNKDISGKIKDVQGNVQQ
jgi:hypothetical protein